MNTRTTLIAASMAALLAAAGSAFAAGPGGGGENENGAAGAGTGADASGVYSPPTRGIEQGATAEGSTKGVRTSHKRMHHAKKPMNDTTNMPGADASSDTKGQ